MNKTSSKGKSGDGLENFVITLSKGAFLFWKVAFYGVKALPTRNPIFWGFWVVVSYLSYWVCFKSLYFLALVYHSLPEFLAADVVRLLYSWPKWVHFAFFYSLIMGVICFFFGLKAYAKKQKTQNAIDRLGLKDGVGSRPKVLEVIELDRHRQKLVLTTGGVGIEQFQKKAGDLESALGMIVHSIERSPKSHKNVEVNLRAKRLPQVVRYHDLIEGVKKPYSFVVGESMDGPIYCSINELPHLLVAGMTGSGKSVFLKNALLSMLETSDRIQLFLIDLKRGVEVKEFASLPNVKIAKNESEAVNLLRQIKQEMEERFQFLEKNGLKEIDPKKHKKDQIVVVVDEASVLYGKESAGKATKALVDEAREITDNIAKVSRVTRISLILATQKISKETIDTKVQENMGAKLCFRTSTLQNSMVVLGSPEAYKLPAVKGRAYWRYGLDLLEVQTPFMDDGTKKECIEDMVKKFKKTYEGNEMDKTGENKNEIENVNALEIAKQEQES